MRTPFVFLAGLLATAACGPMPNVVYVPVPDAPAPAPAPAPLVVELPPVGVTIARVDDDRMLVSTNQPAYLAVFEIIPDRGVALVYPSVRMQRRNTMAGSNWVTLGRSRMRDDDRYARDDRDDRDNRLGRYDRGSRQANVRYLYAIASDRPLRLPDAGFDTDDDYLRDLLGDRDYRARDPYRTMEALSRRVVQPGRDAEWGEDLATMDIGRPAPELRVAKVYCPDGSVYYVHEEMADRAVCAAHGRGRGASGGLHTPRPDSVVASAGKPLPRYEGKLAPPVFRIPTRTDVGEGVLQQGGPDAANHGHGNGNGGGVARGDSSVTDGRSNGHKDNGHQDNGHQDNGHQDNGNHYGRDGGKPSNGNGGQGNGAQGSGGQGTDNAANGAANNANHGNGNSGNPSNGNNGIGNNANADNGNGSNGQGRGNEGRRPAVQPQPQPVTTAHPAPATDAKPDTTHRPVKQFLRGVRPDAAVDTARVKP